MLDRTPISSGLLYCLQLGEVSLFYVERKRSQHSLIEVPYLEELWIQKGTLKPCGSSSLHQSTKKRDLAILFENCKWLKMQQLL